MQRRLLPQNLYESIKNEPFKIPEDDGNDLTHTFFNPDREGWLLKLGEWSLWAGAAHGACACAVGQGPPEKGSDCTVSAPRGARDVWGQSPPSHQRCPREPAPPILPLEGQVQAASQSTCSSSLPAS